MADPLQGLNEGQREAVLMTDRHLLVVAGPGSGKTLTIVRRIAHLIETGVRPKELLAVTFTNRAAREMRERIAALMGKGTAGAFIGTFHLLGLRILRDCGIGFSICSREEQIRLIESLFGCQGKAAREIADSISRVKNLVEPAYGETIGQMEAYGEALREKGMCDFDDLITLPADLVSQGRARPHVFSHMIVDEYQDISPGQYRLLRCLINKKGNEPSPLVCAVGDSDQAIYGFRGADLRNFLDFRRDFPEAAVVVLKENYRSTASIVEAAGGVIRNNRQRIDKELVAVGAPGGPVTLISVPDERAEAETIVGRIEARMGGTSHYRLASLADSVDFGSTTYCFSDFAVLFRTNAQAKVLSDTFSAWGIPCQVIGEKASIGRRALIDELKALQGSLAPDAGLEAILDEVGERSGDCNTEHALLANLVAAYADLPAAEALGFIIDELSILGTADAFDPRADAVTLSTMHMAKGLEFRVVFVAGAEEGLLPFAFGQEEPDAEEERRLFYVAMTRAKEELFVIHARKRFLYGRRLTGAPSPFLSEIPPGLVKTDSITDKPKKKEGKQMGLFG